MHLFSPDGSRLAFIDAQGLTLLTFPNKAKTERTMTAGFGGLLSQDEAGKRLLAWDDDWERLLLYDAKLAAVKRYARFDAKDSLLHPDGEHLVRFERDALVVTALEFKKEVARTELGKLSGLKLAKAALGPARSGETERWALALHHSGTFVCLHDGVVYAGQVNAAGKAPALFWKMPIEAPTRQLKLFALPRRVAIVALDRATSRAFVVLVDSKGARRDLSVPAIAMPDVTADFVVFQKDDATVCRQSLSTQKVEEFSIDRAPPARPMGKSKAKAAKPAGVAPLPRTGPGQVMAAGEKVWFLPWHGEVVVELTTGEEISRKLPDKERPVRELMLGKAVLYQRIAAASNGAVCLGSLKFGKRNDFGFTFHCEGGDGSLCQGLVHQLQNTLTNGDTLSDVGGYHYSSGGSRGGLDWSDESTIDVPGLEPLLRMLDANGMNLASLLEFFNDEYERPRREDGEIRLTRAAEQVLLHAVLDTLAEGKAPPHAERLQGWAQTPVTANLALEKLAGLGRSKVQRPYRFHEVLCRMLVHQLGPDAAPVLENLFFDQEYDGYVGENLSGTSGRIAELVTSHPELKARFLKRCEETAKREGDFGYYRDGLRDQLQQPAG